MLKIHVTLLLLLSAPQTRHANKQLMLNSSLFTIDDRLRYNAYYVCPEQANLRHVIYSAVPEGIT